MSVFMDTTTGMGLSGATGVRPYLPPLLAGALARGDTGIDFDGTDWQFLESTGFLFSWKRAGDLTQRFNRARANDRGLVRVLQNRQQRIRACRSFDFTKRKCRHRANPRVLVVLQQVAECAYRIFVADAARRQRRPLANRRVRIR